MDESLTNLLENSQSGDPELLNEVYKHFYQKIKVQARMQLSKLSPGNTITPTVLMHECYLKMMQSAPAEYHSSKHFYACLGKSMRHFLIDTFRRKQASKRKAQEHVNGLTHVIGDADIDLDLMDLEMIFERVDKINPRLAELLEIKLFVGLKVPEIAQLFDCSVRKVINDWNHAKSLVLALLEEQE